LNWLTLGFLDSVRIRLAPMIYDCSPTRERFSTSSSSVQTFETPLCEVQLGGL